MKVSRLEREPVVEVAGGMMRFPFLAITPRISKDGGNLVARTSLLGWLAALTLLHRTVIVDPDRQAVLLRRRLFWLFTSRRRIPFRQIASLSYDYDNWNPATDLGFSGNTTDCFTVKLNLRNGKPVHLFRFFGEGPFVNNGFFPDWMYWDEYAFDVAGTQAELSKTYVTLLQKFLDVPLR